MKGAECRVKVARLRLGCGAELSQHGCVFGPGASGALEPGKSCSVLVCAHSHGGLYVFRQRRLLTFAQGSNACWVLPGYSTVQRMCTAWVSLGAWIVNRSHEMHTVTVARASSGQALPRVGKVALVERVDFY